MNNLTHICIGECVEHIGMYYYETRLFLRFNHDTNKYIFDIEEDEFYDTDGQYIDTKRAYFEFDKLDKSSHMLFISKILGRINLIRIHEKIIWKFGKIPITTNDIFFGKMIQRKIKLLKIKNNILCGG